MSSVAVRTTTIRQVVKVGTPGTSADVAAAQAAAASAAASALVASGTTAPTQETVGRALTDADNGQTITCTSATLQTYTVPPDLIDGFHCAIVQGGAGAVAVSATAPATVLNVDASYQSSGAGAVLAIINTGPDAYSLGGQTA